jgi:hypothetical protein
MFGNSPVIVSTTAMVYSTSVWWKKKIKSIIVDKLISESITEKDSCPGMCVCCF